MLLVLLPIAWLAVVIVIVAACQAAARGDAAQACLHRDPPEPSRERLQAWDRAMAGALRTRGGGASLARSARLRARRVSHPAR
jgi:hypothetical protein